MFETAIDMIQKHLPGGEHPNWVAIVILVVVGWIIFLVIREFWCWYWRTTHLLIGLFKIWRNIGVACEIGAKCREELSKANATLERIAESVSAKAADKQHSSGGS